MKIILGFLVALIFLSVVFASHFKPICHKTGSQFNPYIVISVGDASFNFHLAHGDFEFKGDLSSSSTLQKKWCLEHQGGIPPIQPPVQVPDPHAHVDNQDDAPPAGTPQLG